ncbi:MAG TPA: hypothetical protein VNS34_16200 [Rhizobiaceae bacterium]|nr:hypothetical protein [Rhizobiaceae bacterium]
MTYAQADLEMAERHVAQGRRLVLEQEERIERLRAGGHPIVEAEDFLSLLRSALDQHQHHRDAIYEALNTRAQKRPLSDAI